MTKKKVSEGIEAKIARIDERTENLVEVIADIKKKLESKYVTQAEFEPIKRVVYGVVGLILTAVIMALVYLVVNGPK